LKSEQFVAFVLAISSKKINLLPLICETCLCIVVFIQKRGLAFVDVVKNQLAQNAEKKLFPLSPLPPSVLFLSICKNTDFIQSGIPINVNPKTDK
jgi:hypothetical protein